MPGGATRPRLLDLLTHGVLLHPAWATPLERYVRPLLLADVELPRTRDLLLGVGGQLGPLCHPAGRPRNREQHGEKGGREAHRLVDDARIEIEIRIEPARNEVLVLERDLLELDRDVDQGIASGDLEYLVGELLHDPNARIVVLVETMSEAHEPPLARL